METSKSGPLDFNVFFFFEKKEEKRSSKSKHFLKLKKQKNKKLWAMKSRQTAENVIFYVTKL